MAKLQIVGCRLVSWPDAPGQSRDGYTFRVRLEDEVEVRVEVSDSQATAAGLSRGLLVEDGCARVRAALQRYAAGVLRNDVDVLDQVGGWNVPVVLRAEHFR